MSPAPGVHAARSGAAGASEIGCGVGRRLGDLLVVEGGEAGGAGGLVCMTIGDAVGVVWSPVGCAVGVGVGGGRFAGRLVGFRLGCVVGAAVMLGE